jgi:hypothetical protein
MLKIFKQLEKNAVREKEIKSPKNNRKIKVFKKHHLTDTFLM